MFICLFIFSKNSEYDFIKKLSMKFDLLSFRSSFKALENLRRENPPSFYFSTLSESHICSSVIPYWRLNEPSLDLDI